MTYDEKQQKLKLDRSTAINSKVAVEQAKAKVKEEDDFNNRYLHGDSQYIGINDLIWYYYKEKNYEKGTTYSKPSLASNLDTLNSSWQTILENALDQHGDGSDGFYPPDSNNQAAQDMNLSTPYLNKNGETEGSTGLIKNIDDVIAAIGTNAGDTSIYTSPSTYASSSAAQDAAKNYLYNTTTPPGTNYNTTRLGTGIRGRRTANVEISDTGDTYPHYIIGDSQIDNPNFYGDSADVNGFLGNEKTTFLNAFSTLLNNVDSNSNYQSHLNSLKNIITDIQNDNNTFFYKPPIKNEVGDTGIQTYLNTINGVIGYSGDTAYPSKSTLWALKNYFDSASGGDSNFDNALTTTETQLNALKGYINTRYSSLENYIGGTYSTSESDFTKLRKWRLFWIKARIEKPKASLISYLGMDTAIDNANKQISAQNNQLESLLGTSSTDAMEYIPTPKLLACFYNPTRNSQTGEIIKHKITIVYDGQQHATEYKIYRQNMPSYSSTNITNDQWNSSYIIATQNTIDSNTGFVKIQWDDLSVSQGDKFVYRVQTIDTNNLINGNTTGSLQSNIFDESTEKVIQSINDGKIEFGDSHQFDKGNYVVINDSNLNGYYLVIEKGDTYIKTYPNFGDSSGKVYKTTSAIMI